MTPLPEPRGTPAPCHHLSGYWINRATRNFRCYGCGCQFYEADLVPRRNRKIETWKPKS